jgi:hypothetical protein
MADQHGAAAFAIGVTGTILFMAAAVLAAVSAGGRTWAISDQLNSEIGLFKACGLAFGHPNGCVDIDENNPIFIAATISRWHRIQGIQALCILSCILAGATALLCIVIAVRSKRPSPQIAAVPIWSGALIFVMGLLSLVLFSSLKTDALRFINGLAYGATFGCAIAFTIVSILATVPFAFLVHLAWEDALLAARAGAPFTGVGGVALTPKARAAFVNIAASP